ILTSRRSRASTPENRLPVWPTEAPISLRACFPSWIKLEYRAVALNECFNTGHSMTGSTTQISFFGRKHPTNGQSSHWLAYESAQSLLLQFREPRLDAKRL